MARTLNERLLDFQVAQQIRWIRLSNNEVREARALLTAVEKRIKAALIDADPADGSFTAERRRALQQQIEQMIETLGQDLSPVLIENVVEAAHLSADVEASTFRRILPAAIDVITPNVGVLQTAVMSHPYSGSTIVEWAQAFNRNALEGTWRDIMAGITEGETTPDLVRRVIGSRAQGFRDGTMQKHRRSLEALVRTSISHATNTGRQSVWTANEDLISSVRWVATLDTRTTPICQHRDGRVGPVSASSDWTLPDGADALEPPLSRPPAHPNCRSTAVAVTKSWRELGFDVDDLDEGTRASMDGQVPGALTYFEWLDRQSKATQEDILGATRLKLWSEGGVTPDHFQNDRGVKYTLEELRKRTPKAFEDAGL